MASKINNITGRVRRLFDIAGQDIDKIVIKNSTEPHIDQTFFYLTGARSGIFEESLVIADPDGDVRIITGSLEKESAEDTGLDVVVVKDRKEKDKAVSELLGSAKRIGYNGSELTAESYFYLSKIAKKSKFVDVSDQIMECRMVKDRVEIENVKKAADIASEIFDDLKAYIKEGVSETEIAAFINYSMMKRGASGPSFDTICAAGKNSAEPHYTPGAIKLNKGEFMLCDYGARYNRYASDTTRTFVLKGTEKHKKVYETVLEAQKKAIETVRAGVRASDVHIAAETVINRSYEGRFTHGVGHSLGLAVHDGFGVGRFSEIILKKGMIITAEPGIYIPGFGGVRIEDDLLVTENGCEILTSAPKAWNDITI